MKTADAIIVGGGIQGVSMVLAMARRGLAPLLVERRELAAGASGASYGIVHGGLRYLQTLNIPRWLRARRAQAWFLREFPAHVRPLRCVMPLYRGRLRSPLSFRLAMMLDKNLTAALDAPAPLPSPQLLSAQETRREFEVIDTDLAGAACWYDAEVSDMPGLLQMMLHRAGMDAASLHIPCEAREVLATNQQVTGLRVADTRTGETRDLLAPIVINCAGAWVNRWQPEECPSAKVLAFNLLLAGKLPGQSALAVSALPGKGRSYFLRPHPLGIFAGTYYRPARDDEETVNDADIHAFLAELDAALPGLQLRHAAVLDVMAGRLPDGDGHGHTLSAAERVLVHRPHGFYSVLGGKFTTAPLLSEDAAELIWSHPTRADDLAAMMVKSHG